MADYLPRDGALLASWARTFAARIAAAPAEFGLSEADAAALTAAVAAYQTAHAATQARQTRTQIQVAQKNEARRQMIQLLRRYVRLLKASLPPERQVDLGLRSRARAAGEARAAVPGPTTRPMLHVQADAPLRHRLRYSDPAGAPERLGKPAGVVGLQLFCHVGENPPADPLDARFVRLVTRQLHAVDFKGAQMGQSAFYYGRWQTATGETGPWSQVARMTIAG